MNCKICGKEFNQKSNHHLHCDDCKSRKCKNCGKGFVTNPKRKNEFCSMLCYHKFRWGFNGKCKNCGKAIKNKSIYCSDDCRKDYWNKNEYHLIKKQRYWSRKLELIKKLGGKCKSCGIDDIRVLDINHIDMEQKKRPPKRAYNWTRRLKEWELNPDNLELLCANCHRKYTWEQMGYGVGVGFDPEYFKARGGRKKKIKVENEPVESNGI